MAVVKKLSLGLPIILCVLTIIVYWSMQDYITHGILCCSAYNRLTQVVFIETWLLLTALSAVCAIQIKPHWGKFLYLVLNSAAMGFLCLMSSALLQFFMGG